MPVPIPVATAGKKLDHNKGKKNVVEKKEAAQEERNSKNNQQQQPQQQPQPLLPSTDEEIFTDLGKRLMGIEPW